MPQIEMKYKPGDVVVVKMEVLSISVGKNETTYIVKTPTGASWTTNSVKEIDILGFAD